MDSPPKAVFGNKDEVKSRLKPLPLSAYYVGGSIVRYDLIAKIYAAMQIYFPSVMYSVMWNIVTKVGLDHWGEGEDFDPTILFGQFVRTEWSCLMNPSMVFLGSPHDDYSSRACERMHSLLSVFGVFNTTFESNIGLRVVSDSINWFITYSLQCRLVAKEQNEIRKWLDANYVFHYDPVCKLDDLYEIHAYAVLNPVFKLREKRP